jgi:hypothetical protein
MKRAADPRPAFGRSSREEPPAVSIHLRRLRLTVRTKDEAWAGTDSAVRLWFVVDETHITGDYEAGEHSFLLDHKWHNDFQRGTRDSYEFPLGAESSGRSVDGVPIPPGIQFADWDALRQWELHLEIGGNDKWVFDRYLLEVEVQELKRGAGKPEVIDWGWLELAKHNGDVAMSTAEDEGVAEYIIPLNGRLNG